MRFFPLVIIGFITMAVAADANQATAAPLKQRLAERTTGGNIINNNSNASKQQLPQTQAGIMDKATVTTTPANKDDAKSKVQAANAVANLRETISAETPTA